MAIVRLKRQGSKFELGCYRNKVQDWRNKAEDDINEVLQVDNIFTDIQQGQVASKKDLKKFGKMNREEIIVEILNKGEFQMTDMEREDQLEKKKLDIANWICSQCVNS